MNYDMVAEQIVSARTHKYIKAKNALISAEKEGYESAVCKILNESNVRQLVRVETQSRPSKPLWSYLYDRLLLIVCDEFNIKEIDLIGRSRKGDINEARQCLMYNLSKTAKLPLKYIGRRLSKRDHTTIINGRDEWESLVDQSAFYEEIQTMIEHRFSGVHEDWYRMKLCNPDEL